MPRLRVHGPPAPSRWPVLAPLVPAGFRYPHPGGLHNKLTTETYAGSLRCPLRGLRVRLRVRRQPWLVQSLAPWPTCWPGSPASTAAGAEPACGGEGLGEWPTRRGAVRHAIPGHVAPIDSPSDPGGLPAGVRVREPGGAAAGVRATGCRLPAAGLHRGTAVNGLSPAMGSWWSVPGLSSGYHGDFDWPGVAIAADVIARYGGRAWRTGHL